MESKKFTERRQYNRLNVKNHIVGILNSDAPLFIGSITDISLGGVKFTNNEFLIAPKDSNINSIDLIADDYYLIDIPCECAWDIKLETEPDPYLIELRQSGFQFGKLTPNQLYLLRSLMYVVRAFGTNWPKN